METAVHVSKYMFGNTSFFGSRGHKINACIVSMADKNHLYRSKLRTPKKEQNWDELFAQSSDLTFPMYQQILNTPSPGKRKMSNMNSIQQNSSPHRSGYFLRTPSPQKRTQAACSSKENLTQSHSKRKLSGTPSPHKGNTGMDLFGNRSLLDGFPVPEFDDIFLDNLFFGLGNDDLEGFSKSPKSQGFLDSSLLKQTSPSLSPLKSPLLTSSPKFSTNSPSALMKTPAAANSRPLTRQRKLFLQSPERQADCGASSWPTPLPFSSFDETSSSMISENDLEATTSIQSISTYLKQIDEEDHNEVLPPVGWTTQANQNRVTSKHSGKGKGKSTKSSKLTKAMLSASQAHHFSAQGSCSTSGSLLHPSSSGKKVKVEPQQFTLLRPHTELHNNQICLRTAPRTPPNKVKISRDLSQIQTLPSKEQLKIVRSRFRESLNKAVEQVIEKEKKKAKEQQRLNDPTLRSALQRPTLVPAQPLFIDPLVNPHNVVAFTACKPQIKKRKN
ncbi:hypothetical protein PoB_004828700 [Plakobranchus ocellatus]|uniref:Uncharacterized protein n=1 Tax=Plakobranchus ocellatus TaxID=259542 RepID=A0AAV4BS23_9GAST|nr:hypothetical protein PoB_004828700 [Plakobranchus ocellatus]